VIHGTRSTRSPAGLAFRPAGSDELETCASIWRVAIDDYVVRLGQHEMPAELNPVIRLFVHMRSTDPDRFIVATVPEGEGERIVAFAAAVIRERLWYLSMLFVLPEFQGAGLGRDLLARVQPADGTLVRALATDSAQPISNALYTRGGIVPRMPLLALTGLPQRPEAFGALPSGVIPLAFDAIAVGPPDGQGHRMLVEAIDALDRETLGVAHPVDHRFLRTESRRGWLYRGPDGTPVGYGYAGEAGRVGPVAVNDAEAGELDRPHFPRLRGESARLSRASPVPCRTEPPCACPCHDSPPPSSSASPSRRFRALPSPGSVAARGPPE
jgi:GNAT superfamily N-acetyltransferase